MEGACERAISMRDTMVLSAQVYNRVIVGITVGIMSQATLFNLRHLRLSDEVNELLQPHLSRGSRGTRGEREGGGTFSTIGAGDSSLWRTIGDGCGERVGVVHADDTSPDTGAGAASLSTRPASTISRFSITRGALALCMGGVEELPCQRHIHTCTHI